MRLTSLAFALSLSLSPSLAACLGSPCDPERLDDLPGGGKIRHGVVFDDDADAAAAAAGDGVACLTCDAIYHFDGRLDEPRRFDVRLEGSPVLAVAGDTTFVLDRDFGRQPDIDNAEEVPPHFQLFALSADGRELWRADLGTGEDWTGGRWPLVTAGPASVVVYGESRASVFDAATGAPRWSMPISGLDQLVPDETGGLFVANGALLLAPGTVHATLRHLDADGAETWARTWSATESSPGSTAGIGFDDAVRTADGGVIVTGLFQGRSLDVSERILQSPQPAGSLFVAELDGSGAVRWAVAVGTLDLAHLKVAAVLDGALIGGQYSRGVPELQLPEPGEDSVDAFVARVGRDSAIAAHPLGGKGTQSILALAAADDGSALATVASHPDLDGGTFRVGRHRTIDQGVQRWTYVLNIVP